MSTFSWSESPTLEELGAVLSSFPLVVEDGAKYRFGPSDMQAIVECEEIHPNGNCWIKIGFTLGFLDHKPVFSGATVVAQRGKRSYGFGRLDTNLKASIFAPPGEYRLDLHSWDPVVKQTAS